MFNNVQQCSTMYDNVRQKILPYDSIFATAKSFTWKTFLKICSITYEIIGLTTNNHENPRKTTIFEFAP